MSAWRDFVTAALLGTENGRAQPTLPAALEEALDPTEAMTPAARFLTRAGALALWRRAGYQPARHDAPGPAPCPPETAPSISPASAGHLRTMLGGHQTEVLTEWLGEVIRRGYRVPPELLPALLDRARGHRTERPLVLAAGGKRVRWLAGHHPAWDFAADEAPEHWEAGGREQRAAILRGWRASDPADAREKLAAVWSGESADTRAAFLAALEDGLSDADEPFLERALDDRARDVRQGAAGLLARLPGSAFAARMTARTDAMLRFEPGGFLKRATLGVTLPDGSDVAAKRDGLDPKVLDLPRALGSEEAATLAYSLGAVPLRHWAERFGQTPETLLKAAERHDLAAALITGWGLAAARQHDATWMRALLSWPLTRHPQLQLLRNDALFRVLPRTEQISRLLAAMRADPLRPNVVWSYGADWLGYFLNLAESPEPFPTEVIRLALDQLRQAAKAAPADLPHHLRSLAEMVAVKAPPSLLPEVTAGWLAENPSTRFVAERLAFRQEALAALARP